MIGTRSDNNGPPVQTDAFRLGDVLVTPTRNTLEANGIEVRLQPKVMEVLCYLAYHHKRVVPNEELTREVWRGRVVTHGSVQKSITQLRKAFAAFPGEQEVVTHYARRGYHLQIEPHYLPPDQTSGGPEQGDRQHIRRPALMLLPVIALLLAVVYLYQTRHKWVLTRDHRTAFTQLNAVTVAPGFARSVAPHPDNRHLAYIVDTDTPDDRSGEVSHVVIRYSGVRDWWVAGSAGSWQETAWSPDGRQLAVLELTQEEAAPATQDYVAAEVQLYDIHVFEVDLDNHRVLGKHRLSQWQGHISSLTWWDSATLELVGRQGKALIRQRYRYELGTQRLETVESPDHATNNPLLTRVHNGMTALARVRDDATRIEFLRPDQTRFASYVLDYRVDDISWLPDGSGILASAADQGAPSLLYRDGKRRTLSFDFDGSVKHLHPKYSADGSRIYLTQATPRSELWLHTSSGARQVLQNRHLWRVDAMLSPTGTSLAYVSMADDLPQIRIMALPDGPDYPLQAGVAGEPVHNMIWADTDTLVFKAGRSLYRYSLPNPRCSGPRPATCSHWRCYGHRKRCSCCASRVMRSIFGGSMQEPGRNAN